MLNSRLFLVPCALIAGCASPIPSSEPRESPQYGSVPHKGAEHGVFGSMPDETQIGEAIKKWELFFGRAGVQARSEDGVELLLKGKYRDKARFYWPGTGEYELVYLIDDLIQVHMKCDLGGHIYGKPVAERRTCWLRQADGSLLNPP